MTHKLIALVLLLLISMAGCIKVGGSKSQEEPQVQGRSGNTSVEINK